MFILTDLLPTLINISYKIVFAFISAIPTYFMWNKVVPIYFSNYIPKLFHYLPFWDIVSIFFLISIIGEYINKLVPKIISINNSK